jgi:hypothetical protein
MQALAPRRILREVPKAHTLHTPAHNESPGSTHQEIVTQP